MIMPAKKITADDVMSRVFKSARAEKGLTQEKAAKRAGITQSALSQREKQFGSMQANEIYLYCKIIGIDPADVFDRYCKERSVKK